MGKLKRDVFKSDRITLTLFKPSFYTLFYKHETKIFLFTDVPKISRKFFYIQHVRSNNTNTEKNIPLPSLLFKFYLQYK